MDLLCIGLSHRSAPLAVREPLALTRPARRALLASLTSQLEGEPAAFEATVLATCNRTEVYAAVRDAERSAVAVRAQLVALAGLPEAEIGAHLYAHAGDNAVWHLMRVAAGLDSLVLGEAQVLGQVRDALDEARAGGAAGPLLDALFTAAIRAGRRARAETEIGARAASVPAAAVALARRVVGRARGGVVVVIGAGEMGVLAARALLADGAHSIVVSNRSYARAAELAREWDGCAVTFDRLAEALASADVAIACTGAPHAVVRHVDVQAAMHGRAHRPLVIVDIALPRDVEPEAGQVPGVALYDLDDLRAQADQGRAERASEVPRVEAILDDEAHRFKAWRRDLQLGPLIAEFRRWAEGVREVELARALRRLEHLDERDREVVRALSAALVGKLLHPPMAGLRSADRAAGQRRAEVLRELFALDQRDRPT